MNELESLLRGYLASGDAGELEAFDQYLHADVVLHDPGDITAKGLGHERETWRSARDALQGLQHSVQHVIAGDSWVAARVVVSGKQVKDFAGVKASGKTFSIDQAIFMHIRDGKADEVWAIVDTGSFLRQAMANGDAQ